MPTYKPVKQDIGVHIRACMVMGLLTVLYTHSVEDHEG